MALRSTLAANKQLRSQTRLLDQFLSRHSVADGAEEMVASSSFAARRSKSVHAKLFEASKSPQTGRWIPPVYSLRDQARLVREAARTGRLEQMPDGPVTERFTKRLAKKAEQDQLEQQLAQFRYIPTPPSDQIVPKDRGLRKKSMKPSQRISESERLEAAHIAASHVKEIGPYVGRFKIFKGSKYDREKPERLQNIENKLKAMPDIVRDWQQAKLEAKRRIKHGLPF